MNLPLPPRLAEQIENWDDREARFFFRPAAACPPSTTVRWVLALLPGLIGGIVWLSQVGAQRHGSQVVFDALGPLSALLGLALSVYLLVRIRPWVHIDPVRWQEENRPNWEICFDFGGGVVRNGHGQLIGRFEELELAIHVGQCFGESMFTVLVPGRPEGEGWYLAVLDESNQTYTFCGPGTLPEMEAVGRYLLREQPFKCVRNYVATIFDESGKERPTTTYYHDR